MKAYLKEIREGSHQTSEQTTAILFFGDKETTENLSGILSRIAGASIASGDTDYQMTIDVTRLYANDASVMENGAFSPKLAMQKLRTDFVVNTICEGVNLYVISLDELTNGQIKSVIVSDTGRTFTAYRRAMFCDLAQAKQICLNALNASLATGAFTLEKQPETTTADKLAAVTLAE